MYVICNGNNVVTPLHFMHVNDYTIMQPKLPLAVVFIPTASFDPMYR